MAQWDECPDDNWINIFKNFDLKSRLNGVQVCQKWNQLLKDRQTKMEDVYKVAVTNSYSTISDDQMKILMNSLAHVGKTERLNVSNHNHAMLLRPVMEMVTDGRLRIDKLILNLRDLLKIGSFPHAIRQLELKSWWSVNNCIQLAHLERLTLEKIYLDPSMISLPSLKYLHHKFAFYGSESSEKLNTTLAFLPSLEELRISDYAFIAKSFEIFLSTIQDKLPILQSLYLDDIDCSDLDLNRMTQFESSFRFSSLKKVGFQSTSLNIIRLFIRCTDLDTIRIDRIISKGSTLEDIYQLMTSSRKKINIKLELALRFLSNSDLFQLGSSMTLAAFEFMLTKLTLRDKLSFVSLNRLLDGGSFDELAEINFEFPINDDTLKIISQSCLALRKLRIRDSKLISENGLKWFFINWPNRKSKQLTIECVDSISIDGLFGTSIEEEKGILDEKWFVGEENENGVPSSKKGKKLVEDEKRWMIFQKIFPGVVWIMHVGTRLVIWDQCDSDALNQKILVIKNYDKKRLDTFKKVTI